MAVTITRTAWTDDDGSGTTGTVINNAVKTEFYNQIDTALAALLPLVGGAISGPLTLADNVGLAAAKKLYLDGVAMTGDTYITEGSANVLSIVSGGVAMTLTSGVLAVSGFGSHLFSAGAAGANSLTIRNTSAGTGNYAAVNLGNDLSASTAQIYVPSSTYTGGEGADRLIIASNVANGMSLLSLNAAGVIRFFAGGSTEVGRWDVTGSLQIGGTAVRAGTAGTKRLDIFDGTAPTSTLTNGISLYSTSGELRVMDAAGNATLLSPHDQDTNEWIFDSVDTVAGRRLRIEVERLLRRLDQQFGGGFVHERAA